MSSAGDETTAEVLRSGRDMLRDLWSFESEDDAKNPAEEESTRPSSLQSSVSSARSSSARSSTTLDEVERRAFASIENGISNLDVNFSTHRGSSVVHEGWLVKRGHNWKTWKKRWFVLTSDAKLEYFKKRNRKKSKGKVDLRDGIIRIQYVDVQSAQYTYAFCVLKGFYTLLCSCETAAEADVWVRSLRQVRLQRPTEFEGLSHHVGMFPTERSMQALLDLEGVGLVSQLLRFQRRVLSSGSSYSSASSSSILSVQVVSSAVADTISAATILAFIHEMEEQLVRTHHALLFPHHLPSDHTVTLEDHLGIRVVLEDRVFLPVYDVFYKLLPDVPTARVQRHLTTLRTLPASRIFDGLNLGDTDWSDAIASFAALDTASLPTHKLRIFQRTVDILGPSFAASSQAFRYLCIHATLENVALQATVLRLVQRHLPIPGLDSSIAALAEAIVWIANFDPTSCSAPDSATAAAVSVNFATPELGIQFAPHWSAERGARVFAVQKNSQANLSASVTPGLVLIAVNDIFVTMTSLMDIVTLIRHAALPKRLVFLPEAELDAFLTPDCHHYLLCSAAYRGEVSTVQFILERCPYVNIHTRWTWQTDLFNMDKLANVPETALHAAVHGGHIELVSYLLDDLALDPNILNSHFESPLHAMVVHIAEIAPLLVTRGGLVDAPDKGGQTPLLVQCRLGSKEGVITLVGLGANVHTKAWASGMTPLLECARLGYVGLVDFLLHRGAHVNDVSHDKETALHFAAASGNLELIKRLLQSGAPTTLPNRDGLIPAMLLLKQHKTLRSDHIVPCFRALVQSPSTMQCSDIWGCYIVHFATSLEPRMMKEVMEVCLEKGANGHVEDIFGDSAKDYRKHPKDHGEYVPPTSFMRHLHVTVVDADSNRAHIQNGKIEDILSYLVADKSTQLSEIVSFILNFQAYMDIPELLALFKTKYGHHDAKYTLKHAWSVMAGGSFLRDNHPGGLLFLSLLGLFYPHLTTTEPFLECLQLIGSSTTAMQQHITKFQYFYNVGQPDMLYHDLYLHMIEMYEDKHAERSLKMERLALTTSPFGFAKQCTLLTHALFCHIPIRQLLTPKCQDVGFLSASHWFQHLSSVVVNYILIEDSPTARARVICFFIDVAELCFMSFQNFDTFIAIIYALKSTPIFRLKITFAHVGREYTEKLQRVQTYTQSGCREMNRVMKTVEPPCMPYLGLYLQNVVGLHELPKYEEDMIVNFNRLRILGGMAQDLMKYQAVHFPFHSNHAIEEILHVTLAYPTEEEKYNRSHAVESKEDIENFNEEMEQREQGNTDTMEPTRDSLGSSSWTSRLRMNSTVKRRPSNASAV
ncbi:unnamed protein product [Aphanomyces euteiches]